jgi:predicted RNA binding protein YcfA (HicA-like mRNA interferase family)
MGKHEKVKEQVCSGESNANICFDDLCKLVRALGFAERTKGSHHIFSKSGVHEIINLQPDSNGKAKSYQVRQVRSIILHYGL